MDKLKIAMEHKFWILASLALVLPPVGWWMATGELRSLAESRKHEIESRLKEIPDTTKDPLKYPNSEWTKQVKQLNTTVTSVVDQSQRHLFKAQHKEFIWPEMVAQTLKNVKYRGECSPEARRLFVGRYDADWRRVIETVEPFKPLTGEGKVLFLRQGVYGENIVPKAPVADWRQSNYLFTASQMWDAQEDLWLLKALFESIQRVNKGATEIGNASIKQLREITLRGGSPADLNARRSAATKAANAGPSRTFSNRRENTMGASLPSSFDADDVFGSEGSAGLVAAAAADATRRERRAQRAASAVAVPEVARYVDSITGKSRSRGFVLKLVMDQRQIPTLLGELSASPFPVEFRHVEFEVHNPGSVDGQLSGYLAALTGNAARGGTASQAPSAAESELRRKITEQVRLALNQNYMVDVIVAGTLTVYDEPPASAGAVAAAPGASPSAAPTTAPSSAPVATGPAGAKPAAANSATGAPKSSALSPAPAAANAPAAQATSANGAGAPAVKGTAPSGASPGGAAPAAAPVQSKPAPAAAKGPASPPKDPAGPQPAPAGKAPGK